MTKTLVLVPGLGSDAAVWRRTVAALDGEVSTLIGDTFQDDSLGGMADRILAAAPPRFVLAGISMGGMVAMEIMRRAPERVRALALLDTSARPDTEAQTARRQAANAAMLAAKDLRDLAAGGVGALVHPGAADDVRRELIDMTVRVGAKAYVRQNLAVAARSDLRPVLPTIAVPTQVVVGREDRLTPPELSQEIQQLIPGAQLQMLPDCGHLPPIERPEATAALLSGLLSAAV